MTRYRVQGKTRAGHVWSCEVIGSGWHDALGVAEEAFPGFRAMVAVPIVMV
jgi:hypothetical protein